MTIECYEQQAGDVALGNPCDGGATNSDGITQDPPDLDAKASDEKFFKITSTGYDNTTGDGAIRKIEAIYKKYKFVTPLSNPSSEITFPFDPGKVMENPLAPNPSALIEEGLLEEMKSAAEAQGNCYAASPTAGVCSKTASSTIGAWPAPGAIYFADGTDITLSLSASPEPSGMPIVRGGDVNWTNGSADFQGVIIVIGDGNLAANGNCAPNSGTGYYTGNGQVNLDGYVAASGCIRVVGDVEPSTTIDYTHLNSFYDVKLWSWRELYE